MRRSFKIIGGVVGGVALVPLVGYVALRIMWSDTHGRAPESATGIRDVEMVQTSTTMVVSAHPLATRAGQTILEGGGSALDAAVAVQAALTVVEPQSSGIGGGAFLLYWDSSKKKLFAYDGRETAPASATNRLFMNDDGSKFNFVEAVVGGRSVGVPGVLKMLAVAHQQHGARPWSTLFQPAIELATDGFEVTPRLNRLLHLDPLFRAMPAARSHFYDDDGAAQTVGTKLTNPALAEVLRSVSTDVNAFYEGPIAQDIVDTVRRAKRPSMAIASINQAMLEMGAPSGIGWLANEDNAGLLTLEDLKKYEPEVRAPVCIPFRALKVCGFPPPTSGGITTLQIIGIVARFDLDEIGPRSGAFAHLFAEASRVAFADRNRYIADPAFVDVPVEAMLSPAYLDERAKLITTDQRASKIEPGVFEEHANYASDESPELPSTSHFVIADAEGDMVSMTTSVENVFGSRLMVRGFVLNNQLTDFSFVPERNGKPIANALAPGKRPRSSMSPLLVFNADDQPLLAIGSPGGSRIIDYTAQATLGVIAFGLSPQDAVELPHVVNRGGPTELENTGWRGGELAAAKKHLEGLGHKVVVMDQNSGLHAIHRIDDGWRSGADPRREGAALGH